MLQRVEDGGLQGEVWGAQPRAFTFNHGDNLARHGGAPPLVLALEWQREAGESYEFKTNLLYTVSSRTGGATQRDSGVRGRGRKREKIGGKVRQLIHRPDHGRKFRGGVGGDG